MVCKSTFATVLAAATAVHASAVPHAHDWSNNGAPNGTVFHNVMFELAPGLPEATVQSFCNGLLSLKTKAISPSTHKPYIISSAGGTNNSPEGTAHNYTVGFVSEFASIADRDYFVFTEPTHQAWKAENRPNWVNVLVLDFSKGDY